MRDFRITYKVGPGCGYRADIVHADNYQEVIKKVGNPHVVRSMTMRCEHENCQRWVNGGDYCWQHEKFHEGE